MIYSMKYKQLYNIVCIQPHLSVLLSLKYYEKDRNSWTSKRERSSTFWVHNFQPSCKTHERWRELIGLNGMRLEDETRYKL